MNDKNIQFYNNLGVDNFKQLSEIGGFSSFVDMELIYPYINNASSVLELGAGYGRCLDFLINKGFTGKLIAVEKATPYLEYLNQNYSHKAEILNLDIKQLKLKEKVDVILWMFSGIIDFSKEEQLKTLKLLYQFLNPGGKLVLDIPRIGFKTYAEHKDLQRLRFDSEYGILECYIPDFSDIKEYQEEVGFSNVIRKDYETPTNKARTIYIYEK